MAIWISNLLLACMSSSGFCKNMKIYIYIFISCLCIYFYVYMNIYVYNIQYMSMYFVTIQELFDLPLQMCHDRDVFFMIVSCSATGLVGRVWWFRIISTHWMFQTSLIGFYLVRNWSWPLDVRLGFLRLKQKLPFEKIFNFTVNNINQLSRKMAKIHPQRIPDISMSKRKPVGIWTGKGYDC